MSNSLPSTGSNKGLTIADPRMNFRGMSYGNISALWANWLVSTQVDSFNGGNDMLFLRANSVHVKTGVNAYIISEETPLFIPVHIAQFHIGALFNGTKIESEVGIRHAIHSEIKEYNNMWLTIESIHESRRNVVEDLYSFYVESPLFRLNVSEKSPLREKLNPPIDCGIYDAVIGGYFVLLGSLPIGTHLLRFGSKGAGSNYSDAYYEINVKHKFEKDLKDVSSDPPHYKIRWPGEDTEKF